MWKYGLFQPLRFAQTVFGISDLVRTIRILNLKLYADHGKLKSAREYLYVYLLYYIVRTKCIRDTYQVYIYIYYAVSLRFYLETNCDVTQDPDGGLPVGLTASSSAPCHLFTAFSTFGICRARTR